LPLRYEGVRAEEADDAQARLEHRLSFHRGEARSQLLSYETGTSLDSFSYAFVLRLDTVPDPNEVDAVTAKQLFLFFLDVPARKVDIRWTGAEVQRASFLASALGVYARFSELVGREINNREWARKLGAR
jgi:hypothetical protein